MINISSKKTKSTYKNKVITIILVLVLISFLVLFFGKPVVVQPSLIAEFPCNRVPISECPIFWAQIHKGKNSGLYFEEDAQKFLDAYNFEDGPLIISWGRPLNSLSYRRIEFLKYLKYQAFASPIFGQEDRGMMVYIYTAKEVDDVELIDYYTLTLTYPETIIVE